MKRKVYNDCLGLLIIIFYFIPCRSNVSYLNVRKTFVVIKNYNFKIKNGTFW